MKYFTNEQYANICKLLQYLRDQMHTPMGDKYNHGSYTTCSIGFAAVSCLFPDLAINVEYVGDHGEWRILYVGAAETHSRNTFGNIYTDEIATQYTDVISRPTGKEQLAYVINKIEMFLRKYDAEVPTAVKPVAPKAPKAPKVKKPNPATAGKRIEARIARMKKIQEDIAKLGADAKFFTVNQADMDAQIALLEDALNS
jgi:hypothetical protein